MGAVRVDVVSAVTLKFGMCGAYLIECNDVRGVLSVCVVALEAFVFPPVDIVLEYC